MSDSFFDPNIVTLVAGFGGAVLGSVVSGLVTARQNSNARRIEQKAGIFKLMIKSSLIQSDFENLLNSIQDSVAEADRNGLRETPKWAKVQANAGAFDKISIDPEDLLCLFEAREFKLLNELVELGMKHGRVIDAFNLYSKLRTELKDHMPRHDIRGPIIGANLNPDDQLRLGPRFLELSSILDHLDKLLPRYLAEAANINTRIGPAARKFFKDKKFPILVASDEKKND